MSINIITEFKTKPGKANALIALMRQLMPENLKQPGCEDVSIRQNQDEPDDIIAVQKWATRQHYESYVARRMDKGVMEKLNELLVGTMQARYFTDVPMAAASPPDHPRRSPTLQREVPKISTSDAPGG